MQQSSATQSLHLDFWGLRKIVACSQSSSQCLLVSIVFGTVSSLHPTYDFYTCYAYNYVGAVKQDFPKESISSGRVTIWTCKGYVVHGVGMLGVAMLPTAVADSSYILRGCMLLCVGQCTELACAVWL